MACVLFGSRRFTVAVDVNVRDTFGAGAFLVAAADATAVPLGSDGRPLAPLVAGASYSLLSSSSTQLKQQLKETTGKLNAARNDLAKLSDRHAKLITTVGAELVHLRSLVSLGDSEAAAAAPSSGLGELLSALPAEPSGSALAHAPPPTAECADGGAPGALRPWSGVPIGEVRTCFIEKNGTPRQGCVCPSSTATLTLKLGAGLNAVHSLEGLSHFSHVWLLFIFDQNGNAAAKSKVHPPRLDGAKVGLFATRTPHRPNNIGLSLVRLQKVAGDTLHLSGVDLVDHTPILDVKPYVPFADGFALPSPPSVAFTEEASAALAELAPAYRLFDGVPRARQAIVEVLSADPRSVHWREKRESMEYGFSIDVLNVVCTFEPGVATVVQVQHIDRCDRSHVDVPEGAAGS